MSFRPDNEIEASFRRTEQILDASLEESRTDLEREGIVLRDETNRSGFDGSGFPSFVWAYCFEKRAAYGSEIKLARARLWYREPIYEEEAQRIDVTSWAEIFQTGKHSRVRETKESAYSIERFLDMGLKQVVMNCIVAAERVLAKYQAARWRSLFLRSRK